MNDTQDVQIELLELTSKEAVEVTGGPQVVNDQPALIDQGDLSAISGGPQVINDQPVLIDHGDLSGISGGPQVINDWPT